MSAQHMKMQRPELDVALTDGEGYVVEDMPYRLHLKTAVEIKQVGMLVKLPDPTLQNPTEKHLPKSQGSQGTGL
jgi:hypothetical protein